MIQKHNTQKKRLILVTSLGGGKTISQAQSRKVLAQPQKKPKQIQTIEYFHYHQPLHQHIQKLKKIQIKIQMAVMEHTVDLKDKKRKARLVKMLTTTTLLNMTLWIAVKFLMTFTIKWKTQLIMTCLQKEQRKLKRKKQNLENLFYSNFLCVQSLYHYIQHRVILTILYYTIYSSLYQVCSFDFYLNSIKLIYEESFLQFKILFLLKLSSYQLFIFLIGIFIIYLQQFYAFIYLFGGRLSGWNQLIIYLFTNFFILLDLLQQLIMYFFKYIQNITPDSTPKRTSLSNIIKKFFSISLKVYTSFMLVYKYYT
ncbi:transmembrane protein, putative (macronuclear) [Tetrahymena thermophila SB210]|uniref:Transmembrane protein, putative n=1 Tax=Tetrahymena thermophila (strain SB210) TaxID=312017 RepID=Q22XR2_TETTS|nr:transmembrane protein, putative [Tetrahymena thermophila SB210]EAR90109.2 transmembrane protein, putative [Tetrahymena thermophila SB210]|eukprot:XP_001010354.2 transmembrane protein, putative [Tetrahymena thermophila SB210]